LCIEHSPGGYSLPDVHVGIGRPRESFKTDANLNIPASVASPDRCARKANTGRTAGNPNSEVIARRILQVLRAPTYWSVWMKVTGARLDLLERRTAAIRDFGEGAPYHDARASPRRRLAEEAVRTGVTR
jgi:hypothetical protein